MYVRDLAIALQKRGHNAICYSPKTGAVGAELQASGIEVIDDLNRLTSPPDIIHGHHMTAAGAAFLTFLEVPALFICHGLLPWPETPLINFQQIRKFVAVDEASRDRLVSDLDLDKSDIAIIQNGVDLDRFTPPLEPSHSPGRRNRALIFSNQAQNSTISDFAEACAANGIALDIKGSGVGDVVDHPESILGNYGLVFAKGRAAMEAMACGCNVILADYGKWGGAVTPDNWHELRVLNFGLRAIDRELDKDTIAKEISGINWENGTYLSQLVRDHASLDDMVEKLLEIYQSLANAQVPQNLRGDNEASRFVQKLSPYIYERDEYATRLYEETKLRLGNEAINAGLLVQAMVTIKDGPDQVLVRRLAEQVLFLQPGHPIALEILNKQPPSEG